MEKESSVTVKSISMKWGLINGLVGIVFFVLTDLLELAGNQAIQWVGLLIFAALLVMAHNEFKKEGNGFMSYGQGLGIGVWVAVVSSIINSVFTYLYVSFINPDFLEFAREKAISDMESRGSSDAEIEQAMPFIEMFTSPIAITVLGLVVGVFFAFIASLIVSAITQKKQPENFIG